MTSRPEMSVCKGKKEGSRANSWRFALPQMLMERCSWRELSPVPSHLLAGGGEGPSEA